MTLIDTETHGRPVIAGTRIRVSLIAQKHVHQKVPISELLEAYPHLTEEGIEAALQWYRQNEHAIIHEWQDGALILREALDAAEEEPDEALKQWFEYLGISS